MTYVPHYQKTEVENLWRLAKRRRVDIGPQPSPEQLNDPNFVDSFLKLYGDPPDEEPFKRAKVRAKSLGNVMPKDAAISRVGCLRFLNSTDPGLEDRLPTEAQLDTLELFERVKRTKAPRECRISERAWEDYLTKHISSEDVVRAQDASLELGKRIDLKSLGGRVYGLALADRLERDRRAAVEERIRELLVSGNDPWSISDQFDVPIAEVLKLSAALEREGHELQWA